MIKMETLYDKIFDLCELIEETIGELEEKQCEIEERASNRESGEMTEREQERYDDIEEIINALRECCDNLEYAKSDIEEYC